MGEGATIGAFSAVATLGLRRMPVRAENAADPVRGGRAPGCVGQKPPTGARVWPAVAAWTIAVVRLRLGDADFFLTQPE
jgi:hypothetical protein